MMISEILINKMNERDIINVKTKNILRFESAWKIRNEKVENRDMDV